VDPNPRRLRASCRHPLALQRALELFLLPQIKVVLDTVPLQIKLALRNCHMDRLPLLCLSSFSFSSSSFAFAQEQRLGALDDLLKLLLLLLHLLLLLLAWLEAVPEHPTSSPAISPALPKGFHLHQDHMTQELRDQLCHLHLQKVGFLPYLVCHQTNYMNHRLFA